MEVCNDAKEARLHLPILETIEATIYTLTLGQLIQLITSIVEEVLWRHLLVLLIESASKEEPISVPL